MGYFSNGTEGDMYNARWCMRCVNWKEDDCGDGCPVIDMHMVYNYDQCNKTDKGKLLKSILENFIPTKGLFADKCRMFIEKPGADCIGQSKFEFRGLNKKPRC